jgi:hypothetical protein
MSEEVSAITARHPPKSPAPSDAPGNQTSDTATPTMPGQDAFGAIQEIVRILESDPKTKWSKVNLEALRWRSPRNLTTVGCTKALRRWVEGLR